MATSITTHHDRLLHRVSAAMEQAEHDATPHEAVELHRLHTLVAARQIPLRDALTIATDIRRAQTHRRAA